MKKSILFVMVIMLLFTFTFVSCKMEEAINPAKNPVAAVSSNFQQKEEVITVFVQPGLMDMEASLIGQDDIICIPGSVCFIEVTVSQKDGVYPTGIYINSHNDEAYYVANAKVINKTTLPDKTIYQISEQLTTGIILNTPFSQIYKDLGL